MHRDLGSTIVLDVTSPAHLVFAVGVSRHYTPMRESLTATLDGATVEPEVIRDAHGGRLHSIRSDTGRLVVEYSAALSGPGDDTLATAADRIVYLRPSRYAESDSLAATAAAEFAGLSPRELLTAVSSWVGTRLSYVPGSSLPTDGAVRTLLARQGVCRDYAHLCVALLRASGVPARLVSVYAPGLSPMDFHAVAEAWVDDRWCVVDATTLAPRASLVRIATGRDAADTAFLTTVSGRNELVSVEVTAVADTLPDDDLDELVTIC